MSFIFVIFFQLDNIWFRIPVFPGFFHSLKLFWRVVPLASWHPKWLCNSQQFLRCSFAHSWSCWCSSGKSCYQKGFDCTKAISVHLVKFYHVWHFFLRSCAMPANSALKRRGPFVDVLLHNHQNLRDKTCQLPHSAHTVKNMCRFQIWLLSLMPASACIISTKAV